MKKKFFVLLLAVALCLSTALGLVACGDDYDELQYNVKYIYDNSYIRGKVNDRKTYFVFYDNGTGIYHHYASYSYYTDQYTVKFKYTYLDSDKSTVMCYYDDITFGDEHNSSTSKSKYNDWSNMVAVSKNTLMRTTSTSIGYFVNENYLNNEIPNFAKDED